jgi:hypothetical protein
VLLYLGHQSHITPTKSDPLPPARPQIATPFSRCRAFCRYLLRAGHTTLPAARFRRLRGGIFGWKHKGGPLTQMLSYHGDEPYHKPAPPPMDAAAFREAAVKAAEGKEAEAELVD